MKRRHCCLLRKQRSIDTIRLTMVTPSADVRFEHGFLWTNVWTRGRRLPCLHADSVVQRGVRPKGRSDGPWRQRLY